MATLEIGSQCVLEDNGRYVNCTVEQIRKGTVQVRLENGNGRWLDLQDVKQQLKVRDEDEDEDSSTSSSDNEDVKGNQTSTDISDGDSSDDVDERRQRANSTYVNTHEEADSIYQQLREDRAIGSLVETWSEGSSKWVVGQIMNFEKLDGYAEKTVILLYRIENDDGSITTISKRVLITSKYLRPFVNKLQSEDISAVRNERDFFEMKVAELSETNDEFLLTIDHQSATMEQLQKICAELQKEKEEQEATISDLEATISKQSALISQLMASMNDGGEGLSDFEEDQSD